MKPTVEGSFGSTTIRIDNNNGNKIQIPSNELKMILVSIIPTNPSEVNSVDDWISMISKRSKTSFSDPFKNLRYDLMDGERFAISDYADSGTTQALFFRDKQLHAISIMNLPVTDTVRILKSIDFGSK